MIYVNTAPPHEPPHWEASDATLDEWTRRWRETHTGALTVLPTSSGVLVVMGVSEEGRPVARVEVAE